MPALSWEMPEMSAFTFICVRLCLAGASLRPQNVVVRSAVSWWGNAFSKLSKTVAMAASQGRSPKVVVERIVSGISRSVGVVLTRVWLLGAANLCEVFRPPPSGPPQSEQLRI